MYQKVTSHSHIYTAHVKNLPSHQIIITQFFAHKLLVPTYSNAKSAIRNKRQFFYYLEVFEVDKLDRMLVLVVMIIKGFFSFLWQDESLGLNLADNSKDTRPKQSLSTRPDNHGTNCAGIIAMRAGNGICGVGIAPLVTLGGKNILCVIFITFANMIFL